MQKNGTKDIYINRHFYFKEMLFIWKFNVYYRNKLAYIL